jgi:predicted amidohydrolase YtcJ/amino acid transporter
MQQSKDLGFWMCTALVIGNTIGIGIYVLPASLAPYGFNALVGWAITIAGMTVLARVFARLAREFPAADGPYAYIEATTGRVPAFVALWCYWVSCWITNAAIAIGVVGYLGKLVPGLAAVPAPLQATVMVWLFVLVNLLGVRAGGRVQVLTTVVKLVPMAAIVLLGAWLLATEPAAYVRSPPATPLSLEALMAASTVALFAMLGIESAAVPAGRVRDPQRTIPRATMAGTLLTAAIYVVVSSMALLLVPQEQLAASSAPFSDLLDRFVGLGNGRVLALFVVVSGLGALNGWTLLVGELTASMARHGSLPAGLARLNTRGAPAAALLLTGGLATAMVLMNYSRSLVEGFTFLTLVVTAANLPLYLLCAIALVALWRRGTRRLPGPLLALGVLGTVYSVFAFVGLGREPFLWALVLGAAGLPLYAWMRRRAAGAAAALAIGVALAVAGGALPRSAWAAEYTADGRATPAELVARFETLSVDHGWIADSVYVYPGTDAVAIRAWRSPQRGEALWILAGIHGEEPAGPNAIARNLEHIVALAEAGVPVVLVPLANPQAYRRNWRYPNTAERDWRAGGYSVGDAESLLPDLESGTRPRAAAPPGPETAALTQFVLRLARDYPPRLVLDLHEDELSTGGGYIYAQGATAAGHPVGTEVVSLLRSSGIPIRTTGRTRFDEPIEEGIIARDERGGPIRDGSIDELLAATEVFVDGRKVPGPAAGAVIVVETPAFAGSKLELRVAAHGAVLQRLPELWRLTGATPGAAIERIYVNGLVWTGDPARPAAEAFAVRGDRFVAVGSIADLAARAAPGVEIVDLGGQRVVPGFNDAHWHLPYRHDARLDEAGSVAEIQRRLREYAATRPADAWVTGRGWMPTDFPDRAAHRRYLDEIFPDRPVLIRDRDGHQALANTRALALAGVSRDTPDPGDGRIERDADGEPTGLLKEGAARLVRKLLPSLTAEETYRLLLAEVATAASLGLTSLQDATDGGLDENEQAAVVRAIAEGRLPVRYRAAVPFEAGATDAELARYVERCTAARGTLLTCGWAKSLLDGTVDAGTAVMLEPFGGGGNGLAMWTQADLDRTVAAYDRAGLQVALHAIGDGAIRMALDAYAHAARINGTRDRRHRVEHAEVPAPADLPRFRALGVVVSTQPIGATPDAVTLQNYAPLLGPERAARAYAPRLFDDAGASQAFGSDYPVYSMDPLRGIYAAITRQTRTGEPPGGWYPGNRMGIEAALAHYTRGAAFASHEETVKGAIAPGLYADFAVLSRDILAIPPAGILDTRVVLTVMGGRETFRRDPP